MSKKSPLHKFYSDYSEKEVKDTKTRHCLGCEFYGYSTCKKHYNDQNLYNRDCDYFLKTGKRRVIRPELCPYSGKGGVKKKSNEYYVDFDINCRRCKYTDVMMEEDPCKTCMKTLVRKDTDKPINYEPKESK